jgi:exonuclease III
MKKRNIQIMGIANTRTKFCCFNSKEIQEKYVLMRSGVDNTQRATHGLGFVVHPEKAKHIVETIFISERLMLITINENSKNTTIIQIYAPCNDNADEDNNKFYDQLSEITNRVDDGYDLIIIGDFKWQSRKKKTTMGKISGPI